MARQRGAMLDTGDRFPELAFETVAGGRLVLPRDIEGRWSVLLFYRGHWCQFCRQQLLDFQHNAEYFRERRMNLLAASADTLQQARETIKMYGLTYTVGYGLDPVHVSSITGAFYSESEGHLHATGFILDPEGVVFNGVYSTRSIGRLTASDCMGLIDYTAATAEAPSPPRL